MEIAVIIPARYASSRFPGKPLALICGKPMIEHVYQRIAGMEEIGQIIVATDDERIYRTVIDFGGRAEMTPSDINSGTDRIALVARDLSADIIVNVQGDEPLLKQEMVREALEPFFNDPGVFMSTLKKRIADEEELGNPNVVKVVTDKKGDALYFSRYPVPFPRNEGAVYYKHIGLYVYKREFLLEYSRWEQTPLEKSESLEQLRVLENGYKIRVVETEYNSVGVDTPEDLKEVEKLLMG
ncbi:MAG: 3-deoxy-manno-octulosonate cytidylyltransferase [Halanaerobiaceae bacterium]|jgi:3-deoxy-manno-octulosonate cytidylyltransferase (CMP-KDO synthetase)|nr:3-deoxy-manno-octulosonate cytidylyltransferase [Halanaerobiaceae bacterium]